MRSLPDLEALAAPTPGDEIRQREGPRGKKLDYVDARWVMERLDSVLGSAGWQDVYQGGPDGPVRCGIGVRVEEEWVWKWDVGDPSDIEPTKGAHSDAFKRAAVKWGIARDLYGDHARPSQGNGVVTAPKPSRPAVHSPAAPPAVAAGPNSRPSSEPRPLDDDEWAGLVGATQTAGKADECPVHGQPWKTVPAGTSKAGRPYPAFKACPERDCKERPR